MKKGEKVDYHSVCSSNNLNDTSIHLALREGVLAICENPIVLIPRNVDILLDQQQIWVIQEVV